MLRLKLQPSIPQRESPQEEAIIGGDTWSRALVMDSSGFARLLEVPINEPVRGTPWNHQKACSATAGDREKAASNVEGADERPQEVEHETDAGEAPDDSSL
ncbi:hypothetical protein FJV41_16130 [Myxococcus llanfairpwllgwyngyllgogerychwyrndrobwllllantysiliogogogochensis]|uniref:Uncharacterized protein n=1 Tax=Myxococcus llanfairpwllgwyngyllgogerychwyrndrobwllllantysiliogogogochensis TaxID=2590453 RepID=A0A540X0Y5_9BACT|nr:hypothetical protein [Myxococcus llanfairpwllgwyngyllgogerychwyrndrobwllllantysiliogogogochensis]TQF14915.1 hypothetical protein FJV41_16130 [Myxococcus llanfairpwllgwyngyllgogerychwyrndrobwllllantysiliogogogochensis]